jgi:AraC-like DNA-binding protein
LVFRALRDSGHHALAHGTVLTHKMSHPTIIANPFTLPSTYHSSTKMDPIQAAIDAIESRAPDASFSYRKVAAEFKISRATLARRHQGLTGSNAGAGLQRRNLSVHQEAELVKYIEALTKRGLPPTREMIQSFASIVAKKKVGRCWVSRFLKRNHAYLTSKWTTGIDRVRHKADSKHKYSLYFNLLHQKMLEYEVEPENVYNIDEKGFLIGITGRSKRVFSKAM